MHQDKLPAKKSLGQHFLTNDIVPGWMCDAADVHTGEVVLEIGPGTGALTDELLRRGATVIAIEADRRSIPVLEERFAHAIKDGQLHIYEADIRDGIPSACIQPHLHYKVVANIPYYLTGYLFRLFLETPHQPSDMVFLVQKEIAERIARSQKGSLLSLSVQAFGTPHYVRTVSRGHFHPPPQVESAILAIRTIGHHHIPPDTVKPFFALLRAGFAHKRKRLLSNLRIHYPHSPLEQIFTTLNIDYNARAEDLPLHTWVALHTTLHAMDIKKDAGSA